MKCLCLSALYPRNGANFPLQHSVGLFISEWLVLIYCEKMHTLRKDLCTFMIISRPVFLRMRNVSHIFVEKMKTHVCLQEFLSENPSVYEIMWKHYVESEKPQTTKHGTGS